MSKYTIYYTQRQEMWRNFAEQWAQLSTRMGLTDTQRRGMSLFYKSIGKRFGLMKDFRELGII